MAGWLSAAQRAKVDGSFMPRKDHDDAVEAVVSGTNALHKRIPSRAAVSEFLTEHWAPLKARLNKDKPDAAIAQSVLQYAEAKGKREALFQDSRGPQHSVLNRRVRAKSSPPASSKGGGGGKGGSNKGNVSFGDDERWETVTSPGAKRRPKGGGKGKGRTDSPGPSNGGGSGSTRGGIAQRCKWNEQVAVEGILDLPNVPAAEWEEASGGLAFIRPETFAAGFPYKVAEEKKAALLPTGWENALTSSENRSTELTDYIHRYGVLISIPTVDPVLNEAFPKDAIMITVSREKPNFTDGAKEATKESKVVPKNIIEVVAETKKEWYDQTGAAAAWKPLIEKGPQGIAETADKIIKDGDAKAVHFFWRYDEKTQHLQVGLRIHRKDYPKLVGKAYQLKVYVRQYKTEATQKLEDIDENGCQCNRSFQQEGLKWTDALKIGMRMGDSAFRGIVFSKGVLGVRYLASQTGKHQALVLSPEDHLPENAYAIEMNHYYIIRGFPPNTSRREVAAQAVEWGFTALPIKELKGTKGKGRGTITSSSSEGPPWLVSTQEEVSKKFFFTQGKSYTLTLREERDRRTPQLRTIADYLPPTVENDLFGKADESEEKEKEEGGKKEEQEGGVSAPSPGASPSKHQEALSEMEAIYNKRYPEGEEQKETRTERTTMEVDAPGAAAATVAATVPPDNLDPYLKKSGASAKLQPKAKAPADSGQAWITRWPSRSEVIAGSVGAQNEGEEAKATAEHVNKLIQEGLEKVHHDLFAKLKVGSDKITDEVHREIASVKQEFNNLHVNVQTNCEQVKELGEKLQKTQEVAAADAVKSEERIDKKVDDKFEELKNWLIQNMGNLISTGTSSASAAGHHTPGGGVRSAEEAALEEALPSAKAAKKEEIEDKSL